MKKTIIFLTAALLCFALTGVSVPAEAAHPGYSLDRVMILSRHNIRSPLSGSGSLLGEITPHKWVEWTSGPSELSLRGAILETLMGQYFRLWLENEGFIPGNWRPAEGEVRFYANAKQRTLATARYFSAGFLPVAEAPVEYHGEYDTMDPVFTPKLTFFSDEYARDAGAQILEMGGAAGLKGIHAGQLDAIRLLMDVTDMEESGAYQAGLYGNLLEDENSLVLEADREPGLIGPLKTATSVADALILQYYEEADEEKAAFGQRLTDEEWRQIHGIVDAYSETLFSAPLICVNAAHLLLEEIRSEMIREGRKFTFLCGHDSNVASVLAALGAEEYLLPETAEPKTPIGVKLVFERWLSEDGKAFYDVSLVYQSTEQLREASRLSLAHPPMKVPVRLGGTEPDESGLISEAELFSALDRARDAYDALGERYGQKVESLDDAA